MPARSGTYAVGHDTISIPDPSTGKTITADLWYPAADGATGTFARYSLLPTAYFDSKVAIEDAPINSAGAFPFVVYSHGSGGQSFVASFLTEDLASHGYVVLSANHDGNTAANQLVGNSVSQDVNDFLRPNVVKAEIDWALAQSSGKASAYPALKGAMVSLVIAMAATQHWRLLADTLALPELLRPIRASRLLLVRLRTPVDFPTLNSQASKFR
jgi:predicted dienelactone hydrolase